VTDIEETVLRAGDMRKEGQLDEAERILRSASQSHPDHWQLWAELGHILVAKTNYDKAHDSFLKAIDLNPEMAGLWNNLGYVRKELGNIDGALEATLKSKSLSATETDKNVANYNLACYYCLAGNRDESISCLTDALQADSSMKEWAKQDSDFDSIREDEDFIKLVET
jgi:tetratricopeptide (TPR) repeat protein